MPLFDVLIPGADPQSPSLNVRIEAESWTQALRNGLARMGDPADVRNVLVEITPKGTLVTEPKSGRVFRIVEIHDGSAKDTEEPPHHSVRNVDPPKESDHTATLKARALMPEEASVLQPSPLEKVGAGPGVALDTGVMQAVFEKGQGVYAQADEKKAAAYMLDLAMQVVGCDAGAVFVSHVGGNDLYFAAARGPKAEAAMSFRVPMGVGIVGFSAQEGVALAVSNVEQDPRFSKRISDSVGYKVHTIACAPAQISGRVYGAVELLNKKDGASFVMQDIDVLNYIAYTFADYLRRMGHTGA
jgi:hypothetical protein